jgi:hypothetical protein
MDPARARSALTPFPSIDKPDEQASNVSVTSVSVKPHVRLAPANPPEIPVIVQREHLIVGGQYIAELKQAGGGAITSTGTVSIARVEKALEPITEKPALV